MKTNKRSLLISLTFLLVAAVFLGSAVVCLAADTASPAVGKFPAPKGYVNDFAGAIDPADASELEDYLRQLEKQTTAQVAVVTVTDLDGYTGIEEYSNELFTAWGIGKKGQDNGVLIVLSMKEKKARIEVGYGLEGAITDGTAGAIIRDVMVPYFRAGQFGKGVIAGAKAVAERIPPSGVQRPEAGARKHPSGFSLILIAIFLILVFSQLFFPGPRVIGGRRGGGGPFIGGFGGFGGGFGGFGGGGGGFGGGFGGFGGGGSGGGGASGGW